MFSDHDEYENQINDSEIKGRKIKGLSSSSTKKIAKEEKCRCWPVDSFEDTPWFFSFNVKDSGNLSFHIVNSFLSGKWLLNEKVVF